MGLDHSRTGYRGPPSSPLPYLVEDVPNEDDTYGWAHRMYFRSGEWQPGVFNPVDGGKSVFWSRYASPDECRSVARAAPDNAIAVIKAGAVRAIPGLSIAHTPNYADFPDHWPDNVKQSHCEIFGISEVPEARVKLLRSASFIDPEGISRA